MKKGDTFNIEWDIDGVLSEVTVEFTGKTKRNGLVGQFLRVDTGKCYSLTKKAANEMKAQPWEETVEW